MFVGASPFPQALVPVVAWFFEYASTLSMLVIVIAAVDIKIVATAITAIASLRCFVLSLTISGEKIQKFIYLG
jgi:hypothetical protein